MRTGTLGRSEFKDYVLEELEHGHECTPERVDLINGWIVAWRQEMIAHLSRPLEVTLQEIRDADRKE